MESLHKRAPVIYRPEQKFPCITTFIRNIFTIIILNRYLILSG